MKDYFTKNAQGKSTRNEEQSVKLPLMKTEFGRKGLYFMAAKEYNNVPLQARKIESQLVFRNFLDSHFNDIYLCDDLRYNDTCLMYFFKF